MVEVRFQETLWEPVTPPRELNEWERAVLDLLLSEPFPGRDALQQRQTVRVSATCRCCLSIEMTDVSGTPREPTNKHHGHVDMAMVSDLEGMDVDGVPIWALLFVKNGQLAELEIQRADGKSFQAIPDLSRFELVPRRRSN